MRKVAITTLGCKVNQFESAAMMEAIGKEGFQVVPFEDEADIYLINTCTVTARTDAESRRLIRRASRRNPAAKIVVTGCYAQMASGQLREMPEVDLIIGNVEKKGIVGILKEIGGGCKVMVADISLEREASQLSLQGFAEHTRAFLQVQNGCDAFCSYCIVPHVRGRSRSVPLAEAVEGVKAYALQGFKEVVLTGIHLGGYGLDLSPATTLLELIRQVTAECAVPRLRLGSIEPTEISQALIDFMARTPAICRHLHIPMQSGSDRILALMGRKYTNAGFREVVSRLMTAMPDICCGADIIAGFPGETDDDFEQTYNLLRHLSLAYFHVFPFSPRQGTPAAAMSDPVPARVIRERVQLLRRLSDEKKHAYYRRFVGEELQVLVQGGKADGRLQGLSRNYIPVGMSGDGAFINSEVTLRITSVARDSVQGELVSSN